MFAPYVKGRHSSASTARKRRLYCGLMWSWSRASGSPGVVDALPAPPITAVRNSFLDAAGLYVGLTEDATAIAPS